MSENYPKHNYEHDVHIHETQEAKSTERHISHVEEVQEKYKQAKKLEHARHNAETEAYTTEEIAEKLAQRTQESNRHEEAHVNRELKEMAYKRLLTRARRHMSPYSRLMSHIIHQPLVDTLSETVGKTVGRPSGILGGGILALIGTSGYYYIAKHYGYSYNSFVFLALLALGFILGWALEVFYRCFKVFGKK